jgi:hypothetical protein
MFKIDKCLHRISMRGGYDLYEDENFIYLVDGEEVIATFSFNISADLIRRAADYITQYEDERKERAE